MVWKWSDGRFFGLFSHSLAVTGEWSAIVRVPRPFRPQQAAGQYTLHAWLTAGQGILPYAVAFPLAAAPAGPGDTSVTAGPRRSAR